MSGTEIVKVCFCHDQSFENISDISDARNSWLLNQTSKRNENSRLYGLPISMFNRLAEQMHCSLFHVIFDQSKKLDVM